MPILHSRIGDWDLEHVHAWSDRALVMRAPEVRLVTTADTWTYLDNGSDQGGVWR
jgi:hypothetical protein